MRILIFIILFVGILLPAKAQSQAIILTDEISNGEFILRVKNNLPCPSLITANPDSTDQKFQQFLPTDAEKVLVKIPIDSLQGTEDFKGQLRYSLLIGDPDAIPDPKYLYMLPFPHGKKYPLIQGNNSSFTHNDQSSRYAFDFGMPEGSKVAAVRGGVVGFVREDHTKGGNDKALRQEGNQILVCHDDGTVAIYAHLKHNGAFVGIGDDVFAGQVIGLSGNTGYSTTPHLHFVVMVGAQSIPIQFRNLPDSLRQGLSYKQDVEF